MDQMVLLYIMAAFTAICAIALCAQAATVIAMYTVAKKLEAKVNPLIPKVNQLVEAAHTTVEKSQAQILDITGKTNQILDATKVQLDKVGEVVTDASGRAKVQMERVEMVLDDTMSRAHETVATVHNGIMRPLREINGIAAGVKTAITHLAKGARPSVAQVTSDEEMFI